MGDLWQEYVCKITGVSNFLPRGLVPLGTKKPFQVYSGEKLKPNDVVSFKIELNEQCVVLHVASPGEGKTQIMMRGIRYIYDLGYNCLIFDAKGNGFDTVNEDIDESFGLLPGEKQKKLPFKFFVPSYAMEFVPPFLMENKIVFSPKLSEIKNEKELIDLGFSATASRWLFEQIRRSKDKGEELTIDRILFLADRDRALQVNTKKGMDLVLISLKNCNFFDPGRPSLNIFEEWKAGFIPVICTFVYDEQKNGFLAGKLLSDLYFSFDTSKKFVFLDDFQTFAPRDQTPSTSSSVNALTNLLVYIGRQLGWNVWAATQEPGIINPFVIQAFSTVWKILGKVNLATNQANIMPGVQSVLNKLTLNQIALVTKSNMQYEFFYKLMPLLGHPVNMKRRAG